MGGIGGANEGRKTCQDRRSWGELLKLVTRSASTVYLLGRGDQLFKAILPDLLQHIHVLPVSAGVCFSKELARSASCLAGGQVCYRCAVHVIIVAKIVSHVAYLIAALWSVTPNIGKSYSELQREDAQPCARAGAGILLRRGIAAQGRQHYSIADRLASRQVGPVDACIPHMPVHACDPPRGTYKHARYIHPLVKQ